MFIIIRSRETSQIALATGLKLNKWDILNSVRWEANRHFGNKKIEYLKDKINERAETSKNKYIRDLHRRIHELKE
jgi:hypothetical protein